MARKAPSRTLRIVDSRLLSGNLYDMGKGKKIRVTMREELLKRALKVNKEGLVPALRKDAFKGLLKLKGLLDLGLSYKKMKRDRE